MSGLNLKTLKVIFQKYTKFNNIIKGCLMPTTMINAIYYLTFLTIQVSLLSLRQDLGLKIWMVFTHRFSRQQRTRSSKPGHMKTLIANAPSGSSSSSYIHIVSQISPTDLRASVPLSPSVSGAISEMMRSILPPSPPPTLAQSLVVHSSSMRQMRSLNFSDPVCVVSSISDVHQGVGSSMLHSVARHFIVQVVKRRRLSDLI